MQLHDPGQGRMANLELLRSVAMLLVVVLHFLGKGGGLPELTQEKLGTDGVLAWGMESFAIVAVNVYMLMSGYFLSEGTFRVKRLLGLLLQVWFYSMGLGLLAAAMGYLPEGGFTIHYCLMLLFPISMEHYWFMSAYVFLYVLLPLVAGGIARLNKKQLRMAILIMLLFFSVIKSVLPFRLEGDGEGYDCIWYICVFAIAAYIRRYGIAFLNNKKRCLVVYLAAVGGIFAVTMGFRAVYLRAGRLDTILKICYHYNHILVLTASVAFFCLFLRIRVGEGRIGRFFGRIAPYTLGVYLWHEHAALRYEWQKWLYAVTGEPEGALALLAETAAAAIVVFTIGILLDMLRSLCFGLLHRLLSLSGTYRRLLAWLETLRILFKKEQVNG